ncbi:MAG: NAD-binding protein [Candidatus Hermodarchaeota archaeon]
MLKSKLIKITILARQNLLAFIILILWFLGNIILFTALSGSFIDALLYTFYFDQLDTYYGNFYVVISGFVIFGWILSLLTVQLYRKYYPEQTCLALSKSMRGHAIIIGYTHLGQRIRDYLQKNGKAYVVIEDDRTLVNDLIQAEEPIIPRKPHNPTILENASTKEAKLVLSTKNDLETLVVSSHLIREVNKSCKMVCRCFDDSLAKILEKNLGCETISTSNYASEYIMNKIEELNVANVVLIGCINTTRRLMKKLKENNINYKVIERDEEIVEDIIDEEPIIIGDAKDEDVLKEAGVTKADLVIVLIDSASEVLLIADGIRELNETCPLICRFFHEEVAQILEKAPFNAFVISTSKHTLEKLIEKGVFDEL